MDAPQPGLDSVGVGGRRIPRRDARAPAPPTARPQQHHYGRPAHRVTAETHISDVPSATISGTDGLGHPAVPSGGHTKTND